MCMKELAGKTAFVTGAASGIGLGIATAFAQAGVKVMLCDIEEAALASALEELKHTNADVDGVVADVSLKDELEAAAKATIDRYGKVHILVNNAGVGGGGPYGTWRDTAWDWTLGVNLRSVIWGIEIFGPLIEQHGEGGHIVSTASIAGLISGNSGAYSVTKYGVVALSEGLRIELAPRGIGVSVLCPAFVRTQITNSRRNLPERFAGALGTPPTTGPMATAIKMIRERVEAGVDPVYVGELVREGVENNWPYIFTDTEFEPLVEARFDAIKQGFDRIRGRKPKR
jgi:NAD(P)-dependent dehydrogenase (short-subunit alcohol dehydrogenase family)